MTKEEYENTVTTIVIANQIFGGKEPEHDEETIQAMTKALDEAQRKCSSKVSSIKGMK